MKAYRPKVTAFKFPFRKQAGGQSLATGSYNAPARPGGKMPPIKQFTQMKAGRPKPRQR